MGGVSKTLMRCGACLKWIPVLFITSIVVWSYYAYVVRLCLLTMTNPWTTSLFLILYHFVLFLFLWSYWKTVFTQPGSVPLQFKLSPEELDQVEGSADPKTVLEQIVVRKDLPVSMRSMNGEIRYCGECSYVKPDRCHHCSVCGTCVLKMDHHCPWVNNCVAFNNYKFFILFLGYALLYCLYIAASSFKYFLLFWSDGSPAHGKFHVLFLFFVSAMFSVSLFSLFGYHCYLISRNLTTLEAFRAPMFRSGRTDKFGFHLGFYNNFQEIFGDRKLSWFLPIFTSLGDGLYFPLRNHLEDYDDDVETGYGDGHVTSFRQAPSLSSSFAAHLPEERVPMMSAQGGWEQDDEWTSKSLIVSTSPSSPSMSTPSTTFREESTVIKDGEGAILEPSHSISVNL